MIFRKFHALPLLAFASAFSLIAPALLHAQARSSLVTNRLTQPIDANSRVTLKGTVHPLANALNDRGAAPASMPLDRIQIVLKRSTAQESALKQLIEEQNRPGSANYHKWLTPDQFGQKFGPSDQDVATLEAWLQSQGFNIEKLNPGRQTLEVSGSASQFQNAFHAQIHKYEVNGQIHFANATNPQIPAALAPVFGGFASLNDFHLKPRAVIRGKAVYNPKTGAATPEWTTGSSAGVQFVVSPADFAIQYDLTPLYNQGLTSGSDIAVINEANINVAVVNNFRTTFGLPSNPPQVIIAGNDPGVDGVNNPDGQNGASSEAYVDVEWAGVAAPYSKVDLVIASDTALESGLLLAAEHAVYNNVAPVMSVSFGYCESGLASENAFINNLWEQAAAEGITVVVASGDSGSAGCDVASEEYASQGAAVSGFSSTPYNVSIGGTDFFYSSWNQGQSAISNQVNSYWNTNPSNGSVTASIKGYIPEQPWNDSQYGMNLLDNSSSGATTIGGTGGGPSTCGNPTLDSSGNVVTCAGYAKPSWQSGPGVPNDKVRDTPDVSLFAADGSSNASFYPICADDGDCQGPGSSGVIQISGGGGTSFAAPAFAGIMSLVVGKYGRQGQANYVLYPLAAQYPAVFHDVTNGTNSVPCAMGSTNCIAVSNPINLNGVVEGQIGSGATPEYNAGAGYDLATGLGSVDAALLVNDWGNVQFAASNVTMTPSQTTFTHGTAISISGTVTGTSPTGTVALMTDSAEPGQQTQGIAPWLSGDPGVFTVTSGSFSGSNVNYLPGGTYNIWGRYSGDAKNAASLSEKTQITVTPEASGIFLNALTPSGSGYGTVSGSVTYGTQLQFSAVVAPSSKLTAEENCLTGAATSCPVFGPPTGTVVFSDNGQPFNTATLNPEGDAEYNSADMTSTHSVTNVGTHSITASYSGDNSYNASTAAATTFTVTKATPQIYYAFAPTKPVAGQPTQLTILVQSSGVGAAPSGSVTISGAPSGTPTTVALDPGASPLNGSLTPGYSNSVGLGLITIPSTATAGTYNLTLTYSGDLNYAGTSATDALVIASKSSLKPSTTIIQLTGLETSPSGPVDFTISVAGDGTTAPTGTVDVTLSGYDIGSFPLNKVGVDGEVTLSGNSKAYFQGANLITAVYSGDSRYAGSSASEQILNPRSDFTLTPSTSTVAVQAGAGATDTVQVASVNGFAEPVNLTCTAASGITCTITPSGVVLTGGGAQAVTVTLSASSSAAEGMNDVLITAHDETGLNIHTLGLRADVSGAAVENAGFSVNANAGTLTVGPGATTGNTEYVSVMPSNGFTGAVALTAAVTSSPSGATSPPTLSFQPASVDINGDSAISSALAVATTSSTTEGNYTVEVTGTSGGQTETAQFTVNVSSATFALAPNPISLSLAAGATTGNTASFNVTPSGGFTGNVTFACTVKTAPANANDPPTCSASPANVTGTSAATTTLTVTTTAATTSASHNPLNKFFTVGGGVVIAGLLFFGIPARSRKWRSILVILVFAGIAGLSIGCGSGGSGSGRGGGGGGTTIPGTTAGAYVLTVTGTSGSTTATTTVN
ncbi:MAG: protease pro-enzyme activation domain-containing protein, partial [Acidobacteriaceae bacterium]